MILFNGKIIHGEGNKALYSKLEQRIKKVLGQPVLNPQIVIHACDRLAGDILEGKYNDTIEKLKAEHLILESQIQTAVDLLKKESLTYKLKLELIDIKREENRRQYPLGVLFHIAAGNVEGLPFYSVIEGLLTGNINILKLPSRDQGISVQLLHDLIEIEPRLKDYIYVFDTPSSNILEMKRCADMSDGIVVWGSDATIQAVRNLAKPSTKIIEWGHKLSLAYITLRDHEQMEKDLYALADHIFRTNQVLCSSCQGIYLDTNQMEEVYSFSKYFLRIMNERRKYYSLPERKIQGMITLKLYNEELESYSGNKKVFRGRGCSVIATSDNSLESSYMFGNCWIKPLPRNQIVRTLSSYRGYLQTAGLSCSDEERLELINKLALAGVTKIVEIDNMSQMRVGEAHDGVYPLNRYVRIVEW